MQNIEITTITVPAEYYLSAVAIHTAHVGGYGTGHAFDRVDERTLGTVRHVITDIAAMRYQDEGYTRKEAYEHARALVTFDLNAAITCCNMSGDRF